MLPSATYSGYGAPGSIPGVYQFSQNIGGETVTGSINIVNPSINTGFNNISLVMDGSSHTITFEPLTVPASMDKIKLYTIFVDSSGSYMTSRYDTVDNFNANELYTLTGCCASGDIANVNLYIAQAWNSDGTQVITPKVYPGTTSSGPPSGTVTSNGDIYLRADTGGDCSTIGTWDASSKTCTLTADINITGPNIGIMINSQSWQNDPTETGLILDGNGHTITGSTTSQSMFEHDAVRITGSSANITVKNLTITNFFNGINSSMTNGLTISGVNVSNVGSYGMYLYGTDGLTLQNNTVNGKIDIYEHNAFYGHGNDSCTGTGLYVVPSTTINGPIVLKNNSVTGGAITATPTGICYEGNTVDGVAFPVAIPSSSTTSPSAIGSPTSITGFNFAMSIAVDGFGNVHVADPGSDTVKKFNPSKELLVTISGLNNPFDVGVDNSGNIYVLDQGSNSVKKYDSSGNFITQKSMPSTVHSLSVVGNYVYITHTSSGSNGAVVKLDLSLNQILAIPVYYPQAVTADSSGNIYVFKMFSDPNTSAHLIQKYSSSNTYLV